jgi:hypothetical protein
LFFSGVKRKAGAVISDSIMILMVLKKWDIYQEIIMKNQDYTKKTEEKKHCKNNKLYPNLPSPILSLILNTWLSCGTAS